jgi:ribonucleoside-diphosphate reductase alpha chain
MAAAQPFLSGAISKTINMPNHATIKDINDAYLMSWRLMLKANALYRDGSKLSQPLNTVSEDLNHFDADDVDETKVTPETVQRFIAAKHPGTPEWEGVTRAASIIGHPITVTTHEYEDGAAGQVAINMEKESEEYQGLLNSYSDLLTYSLQKGIPLKELVEKFAFSDFAPGGPVQGDHAIKNATSPVDYAYRVLGHEYLGRQDLVHLKEQQPTRASNGQRKKVVKAMTEEERLISEARAKGYTGDKCPSCGSMRLKRNGSCALCEDCGTTTGCS